MKKYHLALFLVFCHFLLLAQVTDSLNREAFPVGGLDRLALEYYKIDFSKDQRTLLKDQRIEFIYWISQNGIPTLEDINGVTDAAILDSLHQRTPYLPNFEPRLVDGERVSSVFIMQMVFPNAGEFQQRKNYERFYSTPQSYREAELSDFEHIHKSGKRLDMLIGGALNQFVGSPAEHLKTGGGMKIDMIYHLRNSLGIGFSMNVYGNSLKKEFPIQSERDQLKAPTTALLGIAGNKSIYLNEDNGRELQIQLELNMAVQNLTERIDENDQDWTQLSGFSPSLVLHYLIKLGKDRPYYYYGQPSIFNHYLNIHVAIRPMFMNLKAASGIMLETGVAYRFGIHHVDSYQLK